MKKVLKMFGLYRTMLYICNTKTNRNKVVNNSFNKNIHSDSHSQVLRVFFVGVNKMTNTYIIIWHY